VASAPDNALETVLGHDWTGTRYARLYLWSEDAREVRVGVPATCPRKFWLNGKPVHEARQRGPLRPNYDGDGASYAAAELRQGWNDLLVKFARDAADPPFAAHVVLTTGDRLHAGVYDVEWTRLPWEVDSSRGDGVQ
jgi:hypothetical protein